MGKRVNLRNPITLQMSRGALEGWSNLDPGHSKEPLPWITAALMADDMLNLTPADCEAAECMMVQHDSYIRPDTAASLCVFSVVLPTFGVPDKYNRHALILASSAAGIVTYCDHKDRPSR